MSIKPTQSRRGTEKKEAIVALSALSVPLCLCASIICFALPSAAPADVLFYRLPTAGGEVVTLEGNVTVNPGGTLTYQHPRFGKSYFDVASTEIKKAPSIQTQFARVLGRAASDPDKRMEAAQWALRRGLLSQFYSTVDKVLEVDPRHQR